MYRLWLLLTVVPLFAQPVTFNHDIAPVVAKNCAPCHHSGGLGPFPLVTFAEVKKHAAQIVAVTQRRYMPPWPPQDGYGEFAGERRLSEAQIRLFSDWWKGGTPEGSASEKPDVPQFGDGWQMGKPDLILRMPQPFQMEAGGSDVFRNFIIRTGLKETQYVRGFELRVNNPRSVHHANVVLDRTDSLRRRDGEDGHPGFPGMDVITEAGTNEFDPDSHFLFWKPGSVLRPEPEDMSWRLDPATDLILNLHLQSTGKKEAVEAEIGLYFTGRAPTRFPMLLQLEDDGAIDIPAGDRDFAVTDHLVLPVAVDVLAIYPHAHYVGKTVECWAVLPDGNKRWLIRIPDWDINWQAVYEYKAPVRLPKGTRVDMRVTYDNSASNPRNPTNPPKRVRTGNLSEDEMGHVWLQVLPVSSRPGDTEDGRQALQEAVARRRLEKYPDDFLANYNLAALFQSRGDFASAIGGYRDALRIEPASATARNGMAAALLLNGNIAEAIEELRKVLAGDPGYTNARYNLARALAANGDLAGAEAEYRRLVRSKPGDVEGLTGLAAIYIAQRQYREAVPLLTEACRLAPANAEIRTDLGTALAIEGDLSSAVEAFREALRLDPGAKTAAANLARAEAALAAKK